MSFFLLDTRIAEDFAKRRNGVVERADEARLQVIDFEGVGGLMKLGVERGRATRHDLKIGICGEPDSVKFCPGSLLAFADVSEDSILSHRAGQGHRIRKTLQLPPKVQEFLGEVASGMPGSRGCRWPGHRRRQIHQQLRRAQEGRYMCFLACSLSLPHEQWLMGNHLRNISKLDPVQTCLRENTVANSETSRLNFQWIRQSENQPVPRAPLASAGSCA